MRCLRALFLAAVCAVLAPALAAAQDTGSVVGTVFDRTGAPVAGATVKISGHAMPTPRTMVTSDKGLFVFLLLPGEYLAEVEKTGVGRASRDVVVELDRETQCDFIVGAIVGETASVRAAVPDVDLKSTEIKFNFRRALIQDLPLERTYIGLMQLVPGVPESRGFQSNGAGSRQDNTFLLDNVNITNPFFGYLSTEINELDIAEIDVKRGALPPEFGRSTGLISNAVIKSGTNVFTGNYRFEAIPSELIGGSTKVVRSRTNRWDNAFDIGGPLVKNQLFFYGSARFFRSSSPGATNIFGPIPNRVERTQEYFGKVSAQFRGTHIFNAGYRHRPTTIDNAGIGANDAPQVASNIRGTNRIAHINYDWFLGSRTTAAVKFVHVDERNQSTAVTDLGFLPTFNYDPAAMGRFVIGGITVGASSLRLNRQNYTRDEIKVTVTRFFDLRHTSHQVRFGAGWDQGVEYLTRQSNGWGDISYIIVNGRLLIRGTYYPDQPSQRSAGRTYSLFGQDDFSLGPRLTINAGLLLNRDPFVQNSTGSAQPAGVAQVPFPTFGFRDQFQARLGLNYQTRKGRGDKAYINWGRYYGLDQKSSARAVSSGRLYTEDADFDLIAEVPVGRVVSANTGVKTVAPNLDPPVTDEFVVGYATPLGDRWSVDAFYMARRSYHFIEDVPTVLPFSSFQFQNDPFAERKYRTFVVDLKRRLQNNWSLNLSYAWSQLKGNYDPEYAGDVAGAAVFNASSLVDDGPGAFTDHPFQYGLLSQDRTHVYKVLATWVPKKLDRLSLGFFLRGQSGTPWEARGLPWSSGVTYLRLLEPAGSHRTPFWTNTDLLAKYTVKFDAKRAIRFEARLLNVFNQETVLLVDQRKFLDPRILTILGTPTPGCWSCYTDAYPQGVTLPNTRFGEPIAYARPRRLLLSVLFDF